MEFLQEHWAHLRAKLGGEAFNHCVVLDCRVLVFRTLTVDDRLAATVPGVRPRVQLLFQLCTAGRIGRARDLFAYLARTERDPSALADDFYVRVGFVLGGRLPAHKILISLLKQSAAATIGGFGR